MLFSDPSERYGVSEDEVIKYFIDNFDAFNTKEKETIIKLIIIRGILEMPDMVSKDLMIDLM